MADMKSKGRATGGAPRGEDNGNSKLDQYAIIDIRDLFSKGWSKSAIARRFGVTPRTIRQIVNHETWQMV